MKNRAKNFSTRKNLSNFLDLKGNEYGQFVDLESGKEVAGLQDELPETKTENIAIGGRRVLLQGVSLTDNLSPIEEAIKKRVFFKMRQKKKKKPALLRVTKKAD
jgi:hypothetical protein